MKRAALTLLLASAVAVQGVDQKKFRVCDQTAFCKRTRQGVFVPQRYGVESGSVSATADALVASIRNGVHPLQDPLELRVQLLKNGAVRASIREREPLHPRWEVQDVIDPAALEAGQVAVEWSVEDDKATGVLGDVTVVLTYSPLTVEVKVAGQELVRLNGKDLLQMEPYRADKNPKPEPSAAAEGDDAAEQQQQQEEVKDPSLLKYPYDSEGMWGESFGGHKDSAPRGPAAVALDVQFTGAAHVYGIPEHASDFALKNTRGEGDKAYNEPYRLYNLDVFEYDLDVPMALYGAVPFLIGHSTRGTAGVLWLNSAETFVDIEDGAQGKQAHWMSESGVVDVYVVTGPTPQQLYRQYAELTGFAAMPQRFATAYHQCRWNYKSEDDVAAVDAGFDEHDIPYDTLWLDIEHTDGKKYFTWDHSLFPTPEVMQQAIGGKGRKMVTIIDPHIKRDNNYHVHKEATAKDLYVKKADGSTYDGHCWPGSSSYLDFYKPEVRAFWAEQFKFDKYTGSTPHLFTWNDMNEPSVFSGPEVTMPKDNLHMDATVEHRDVHNMYGFYHQWATAEGQLVRQDHTERPFVLTRSFFAGSQRYGAVWTGDNKAEWEHLRDTAPMLLSLSSAGISFCGADVGGFFGDPDVELLTRWYQSAAFQPFFRGHAHIDTKRREPWLFGEPHTSRMRAAIRQRYALLPYVYSTFQESTTTGLPVMRPLWLKFSQDAATFDNENQFMLGSALMVVPVVSAGVERQEVYLPGAEPWYELRTGVTYASRQTLTVSATLDEGVPVFQHGGSVVPRRERARRSSRAMEKDPFTLSVALDSQGAAQGRLYLDDGHSFAFQQGAFLERVFSFADNVLTCSAGAAGNGAYQDQSQVERVVVRGVKSSVRGAELRVGEKVTALTTTQDGEVVTVRKPAVTVASDFTITLMF